MQALSIANLDVFFQFALTLIFARANHCSEELAALLK